jgi:hypothetical protein
MSSLHEGVKSKLEEINVLHPVKAVEFIENVFGQESLPSFMLFMHESCTIFKRVNELSQQYANSL